MGKGRENKGGYNDFLDGERLADNAHPHTSLHSGPGGVEQEPKTSLASTSAQEYGDQQLPSAQRPISPPSQRHGKYKSHNSSQANPKKRPLTHFLCLPLVNESSEPQLSASLTEFRRRVGEEGWKIPEKAVRPVGTLHLTLGVMSLDDEGLGEAGKVVSELDIRALLRGEDSPGRPDPNEAESPGQGESIESNPMPPLTISLKSLHSMHSPKATSVLYAEPHDEEGRLYPFAVRLRDWFTEKGLLIPEDRKLKLHATIVNTIYARSGGGRTHPGQSPGGGTDGGNAAGKETDKEISHKAQHGDSNIVPAEPTNVPDIDTALEVAEDMGMGIMGTPKTTTTRMNPTAREFKPRDPPPPHDPSASHGGGHQKWQSHGGPRGKRPGMLKMDARELLPLYKDFVWAENVQIDRVQVCKMGAKKVFDEQGELVGEGYEHVFEKVF